MQLPKLSEIVSDLKSLKDSFSTLTSKLAGDVADGFKTRLEAVEKTVSVALAEAKTTIETLTATNADLSSKLETAKTDATSSGQKLANVNTKLNEALAAMKIEGVSAEAAPEEKIAAMQTAVISTMEKLCVKPGDVPAASAASASSASKPKLADEVMRLIKAQK